MTILDYLLVERFAKVFDVINHDLLLETVAVDDICRSSLK